jgi:fructosamine-3-kinase
MTPPGVLVESAIEQAAGKPARILRRMRLGGGDICFTERIETSAGSFVLKSGGSAAAGLFRAEAEGLRALRRSGTSLRIPEVVACRDDHPSFLVLEDLGQGDPGPDFADRVGVGLAELHRAGSDAFGFTHDNFCGATPQPNPRTASWIEFYGRWRLGHQLGLASNAGLLSLAERGSIERLIARLDTWLIEPPAGPVLIHGDLWSGNLHVAAGGDPALIDPAAYFAHREAELGMMTLFGGFPARVHAAYAEAFPLDAGWRDRNPLYQLYHLMNHLNLFGGGYHGQVMAIVGRYVG